MTARGAAFVLLLAASAAASAQAVEIKQPPVTPPGIKIVDLPQGPVFATDEGMTIFKHLPPIASFGYAKRQVEVVGECIYQCPGEFPPVVAPADAVPVGDFTIVVNPEGVRQWAYKGVRLQTFKYDTAPGTVLGDATYPFNGPRVPSGEAAWIESEIPPEKPPAPPPQAVAPPGVKAQAGFAGARYYADLNGFTLYVSTGTCTGECLADWQPFKAGLVARPVGDWTVLVGQDGARQWAYKGKAVYSFTREATSGEIAGESAPGKWMALVEFAPPLPPEVTIVQTETGPVYARKADGRALYYYGLNHRPYDVLGFNHPGILFGTPLCYNSCAEEFPPLLAAPDAKPRGDWWIVTRVDGSKQWAYRGRPVHSYVQDVPGRLGAADLRYRWTEALANNRSDG